MASVSQRVRLMGCATAAFARANVRYWSRTAAIARDELKRWRERAERIEEPRLRELALAKLREEGFNAQAAAVLATGVRRREQRACVARALVALTVLYDFLDGVTELPSLTSGADPVGDGLDVSRALSEAVTLTATPIGDYYRRWGKGSDDGGYLQELVGAVRGELARLPSAAALARVLHDGATRCAEAQVRAHAALALGGEQAIAWAAASSDRSGMQPREFLAGAASSVLAVQAVIAACTDEGLSVREGQALDRLYLFISVLPTLLDGVVDYAEGEDDRGFLRYYEDCFAVADAVLGVVNEVIARAAVTANGGQCLMILAGIVGYYTSHPGARSEFARPVVRSARRELCPLIEAVLAVVYGWRGARWAAGVLRSFGGR